MFLYQSSSKDTELSRDGHKAEEVCSTTNYVPVSVELGKGIGISTGEPDSPDSSCEPHLACEPQEELKTNNMAFSSGAATKPLFKFGKWLHFCYHGGVLTCFSCFIFFYSFLEFLNTKMCSGD